MAINKIRGFLYWGLLFLAVSLFSISETKAQDFKIRGRLHMDAFYGLSEADQFSNGFNNRRARMGMTGKITDNWTGLIEFDFADQGLAAKDVLLCRTYKNGGQMKIGQFKVPQGLNQLTSSNDITFIERSMVSNIIPDSRRMGIGYDLFKNSFGVSSMIFGRGLGQRSALESDMSIGYALRGVFFPEVGSGRLHIATSFAYEDLMANKGVRYRDRPEARDSKGGSIRLIDANVPDANKTLKIGTEFLYIRGPFSLEAELMRLAVNNLGGENPVFYGYHLQTGYVITGESRSYRNGVVGTVSPKSEKGAWEIALRYSFMDLNDATYLGGEQSNITLGLNRYVTSKLRFMANLILVNTDLSDETPLIGVMRAQFNF